MLNDGAASSSVMVKIPVASEIVALLLTLESVSDTVSLSSSKSSVKTPTVTVLDVWPTLNVSVVADTAV